MEEIKEFIGWLLGIVFSLLAGVFGFFKWLSGEFGKRDDKINELSEQLKEVDEGIDDRIDELELKFTKEIGELKQDIAVNAERDESNQKLILTHLTTIAKAQQVHGQQMDDWKKKWEDFYDENPSIKKPRRRS